MNHRYEVVLAVVLMLVAMVTGCDKDNHEADNHRIAVSVLKPETQGHVPWQSGDAIVLVGEGQDDAERLPLVGGAGTMVGRFYASQGQLIEPGKRYAAFAPVPEIVDGHMVTVSFEGQQQNRYGSIDHLSGFDFRSTVLTSADADGMLSLVARRLVACVTLHLVMPADDRMTSVRLCSRGRQLVKNATYNLLTPEVGLCAVDSTEALVMSITDPAIVGKDDTLVVSMIVTPADYRTSEWSVELKGESNIYVNHLLGMNLRAGGDYHYTTTLKAPEAIDLGLEVDGQRVLWADMNVGATEPGEAGDYFPLTAADMVSQRWGNGWQTPTEAEVDALMACEMKWDGVLRGYHCVGPNGNTVFLPLAGSRSGGMVSDLYLAGFLASMPISGEASSVYYLVPKMLPGKMTIDPVMEVTRRGVRHADSH